MATSKLKLYNAALTICGEKHLADLTEERKPRRLLDNAWDNGAVDACLEMAQWHFAIKTVRLDYDTDVVPQFGFTRAFEKGSDWIVTAGVCSDEYFYAPLTQYEDQAGFWYANLDEIYIRYVSNDANYGGDYALWPATFVDFVAAHLATMIILDLTADEKKQDKVEKWENKKLRIAKSRNGMVGPTRFPPPGSFVTSRSNKSGRTRDRGNRGSLIG